jgi:lipid-binding SYLF domain-containing protein
VSGLDPLLERLSRAAEAATDAATDDDQRAATFVRGLALGALVGAAIAGSTIWQRRHARPNAAAADAAPASDDSAKTETAPTGG